MSSLVAGLPERHQNYDLNTFPFTKRPLTMISVWVLTLLCYNHTWQWALLSKLLSQHADQKTGCTAFTFFAKSSYDVRNSLDSSSSVAFFKPFGRTSIQLVGRLVSPAAPSSCTQHGGLLYWISTATAASNLAQHKLCCTSFDGT